MQDVSDASVLTSVAARPDKSEYHGFWRNARISGSPRVYKALVTTTAMSTFVPGCGGVFVDADGHIGPLPPGLADSLHIPVMEAGNSSFGFSGDSGESVVLTVVECLGLMPVLSSGLFIPEMSLFLNHPISSHFILDIAPGMEVNYRYVNPDSCSIFLVHAAVAFGPSGMVVPS